MDSKLINGDCLEELKKLDDNSVDLLCTDPPYGYGFMGKHWDKFEEKKSTKSQTVGWMSPGMKKTTYGMREFFVPIWKESLRVLKPGALSFVMSAPRSDVQTIMVQTLVEAGFDVSFTPIYWAYATGFPKAMNVGKKTEKENLEGSYAGYQPKPAVEVVIVVMKPLEKKGYTEQAKDNQKGITWLDDCRIPFAGMRDKEQFDKDNVAAMMNFDGKYEKGEGKMYEGGWEKPNREGLSRGIQASRKTTKRKPREENTVFKTSGFKSEDNDTADASPLGRFAANLLVSDKVLDTGKKTKSTGGRAYQNTNEMFSGGWAYDEEGTGENPGKGDEGDFSRYYSLDEWWKSRLVKLAPEVQRTFPFLVVPKASKSEKNMGLDDFEKQQKIYNGQSPESSKDMKGVEKKFTTQPTKNIHPTVKPIQLFSYLVTLGSRKDDVVLDPFMGSGTTPISCVTLDRKYVGIEREKEYFEIAKSRVKKAINPANLVEHDFF
jgi:DNA modification methylase